MKSLVDEYKHLPMTPIRIQLYINNYIRHLEKLPNEGIKEEIQKVFDECNGKRKIEVRKEWLTK